MAGSQDKIRGKHFQLYEGLFAGIMSGHYADGERIPNEIELAESYGVSRPTVAKAIKLLEKRGLVFRKPGAGTFVIKPAAASHKKIGLLMPRLSIVPKEYGHFVSLGSMIVSEISRRANAAGHVLMLNDLPYGNENQVIEQAQQICQQLIDMQVEGVFFMPFELSPENQDVNIDIAERFRAAQIAVVLIDRDIYNDRRRSDFDIVCIDSEQAAYDITKHLIEQGSRNIEFIMARIGATSISRRIRGYRDALESSGLPYFPNSVHRLNFFPYMEQDKSIEQQTVEKFLADTKADALVCVNDRFASIVMDYALKTGIKIPEELRVVGFDDEPFGAYLPVPLTTMRQPATALGAEAMRALISRSQEPDIPPREFMLKAELVVRQSCGANPDQSRTLIQGVNGQETVD